jgi:hypothetical protein
MSSDSSSQIHHQHEGAGNGGEYYIESLKGLLEEKVKMDQEEKKIIGSKHLTFVDKCDAVKSVRSVSRTIEGLIDKEKEKLNEFYMHEGGGSNRQQSPFAAEGSRKQY